MTNNMKKVSCFILNILKHIILLPLYCSMPDKYSGVTYEEWLNGNNETNKKER